MAKDEKQFVKDLTNRDEDYSQWYIDLVRKTQLADYTLVKGCMVIRPYGFALWENVRDSLDRRIKDTGHQNAYFPLFVPESLLKKEAEHVVGFAPECAWVTRAGSAELDEPLAIRPTSEAIIGSIYAEWIHSYRDLPVLINQWANVVRWEKRTRPFLRTTEFLWQEGHTCHRTEAEAQEETLMILEMYREFIETELAIPAVAGVKSAAERFAGASETYAVEALMSNGWALQAGTSHNLGQHFAKAFDIKFLDEDNLEKFVWQTSWGVSTRLIGGVIMAHSDNSGLRLPPRIAPIQVVIVPITFGKDSDAPLLAKAAEIEKMLKAEGVRVTLDKRPNLKPGFKYSEWEMKGVPVRLEIGPKDMEKDQAVLVSRLDRAKHFTPLAQLTEKVKLLLAEIQSGLLREALEYRESHTTRVKSYDEFKAALEQPGGFVAGSFSGDPAAEEQIKADTKATLRCYPMAQPSDAAGPCFMTGRPAGKIAYFARAF
ncbi:MAG: proline--tRNA ligase [Candidatus Sumerlaeota bacterium]|nr:proline--tRNA ligase [Candidatus Sumerlaeota bacterium]